MKTMEEQANYWQDVSNKRLAKVIILHDALQRIDDVAMRLDSPLQQLLDIHTLVRGALDEPHS